jgi:hypothetical protein
MIGMSNSNLKSWLQLGLAISTVGMASADKLTLGDSARLTGTVRSLTEEGTLELLSDLAVEPLWLRAQAVNKVEFSAPETVENRPEALIELINGDLLPASIDGLDGDQLKVTTIDAGPLIIPRSALKSVQMGVDQRKILYSGPKDLDEWLDRAEADRNWRFSEGSLIASGTARASKDFSLPSQFILKFTMKWKVNPNFQVYFADSRVEGAERVDRYYLQFNTGGIEVKREAATGKRFQSVILLPRTPDQFPENQVAVEIRVDRKSSRLHLLLDGEPEATGVDPFAEKPTGGGVTIVCNSQAGSQQEIRGIELLEYDNTRSRHRAEERGDEKTDSLISREDDRLGGHLIGIRKSDERTIFSFKSDFQEEPLEIVDRDVSTLFFAQSAAESHPQAEHSFGLRLRGEGSLRVSSCSFTETHITARHSLLGDLTINRAGVSALERMEPEPEKKSK